MAKQMPANRLFYAADRLISDPTISRAVDHVLTETLIIQEDKSIFCGICHRVVEADEDHDVFCFVPLVERWFYGPKD